jgi:hypothetical protein
MPMDQVPLRSRRRRASVLWKLESVREKPWLCRVSSTATFTGTSGKCVLDVIEDLPETRRVSAGLAAWEGSEARASLAWMPGAVRQDAARQEPSTAQRRRASAMDGAEPPGMDAATDCFAPGARRPPGTAHRLNSATALATIAEPVRVRALRWFARSGLIEPDEVRDWFGRLLLQSSSPTRLGRCAGADGGLGPPQPARARLRARLRLGSARLLVAAVSLSQETVQPPRLPAARRGVAQLGIRRIRGPLA